MVAEKPHHIDVIQRGAINVVVFIPPPVPPVLAPINIRVINNNRPVSDIEFKEIG